MPDLVRVGSADLPDLGQSLTMARLGHIRQGLPDNDPRSQSQTTDPLPVCYSLDNLSRTLSTPDSSHSDPRSFTDSLMVCYGCPNSPGLADSAR